jgi:hypothetical protein
LAEAKWGSEREDRGPIRGRERPFTLFRAGTIASIDNFLKSDD